MIFGHIVSDPAAWTAEQDLQHLRTTVSYFESMRSQLSLLSELSSRLAKTASVFFQLARQQMDSAAARTSMHGQDWPDLEDLDLAAIESYLEWLPADVTRSLPYSTINAECNAGTEGRHPKSNEGERRMDDVFDWFSWDAYYERGPK